MKKIAFVCIVFCFYQFVFAGTKNFNLSYQVDDFTIQTLADSTSDIQANHQGFNCTNPIGAPRLPQNLIYLAVPYNSEFNSISYTILNQTSIGFYDLLPTQLPQAVSDTTSYQLITKSDSDYYNLPQYPVSNCDFLRSQDKGQNSVFYLRICPFIYIPSTCELSIINSIAVYVNYTETNSQTTLVNHSQGEFLQSIVINPEDVIIDYQQPSFEPGDVKYLIITSESLEQSFEPLAEWKNQKGIPAEIVTTEDINANPDYNDVHTQVRIKKCIKEYVEEKNTEFVLIGGSVYHVPTVSVTMSDPRYGYPDVQLVTDLFYECLETENLWYHPEWDENNDSESAEYFRSDVSVGRVACDDNLDVQRFIDKTINYEKFTNHNPGNFINKLLLAGSCIDSAYPFDTDHRLHTIYNHIDNSEIQPYYYLNTNNDNYPELDQTPTNTALVVNEGFNLTLWLSHGSYYAFLGWDLDAGGPFPEQYDVFDVITVNNLSNQYAQGVLYSTACDVAKFSGNGCLGNNLIEEEDGGYVSFIGHSGIAFGPRANPANPDSDPSEISYNYLMAQDFICKVTDEDLSSYGDIAQAITYTKMETISNFISSTEAYDILSNNANLINLVGLTQLGDPSLKLWTEVPTEYSLNLSPPYFITNEPLTLSLNGFDVESTVCISNGDDIYEVVDVGSGDEFTLEITATTTHPIIVTVTGRNKIPYQHEIPVFEKIISGTVSLEDSEDSIVNVVVELLSPNGGVYQTTNPDDSGTYHFNIGYTEYKVRYSLLDLEHGITYYPYTSSVVSLDPDIHQWQIIIPLVILKQMVPSQLILTNGEGVAGFGTISEAVVYAQRIISSPYYTGNSVYINIMGGNYKWPKTGGNVGGFTLSFNEPQTDNCIVLRSVSSGVSCILPDNVHEVNVQINNIALEFQNICFNQDVGYLGRCKYAVYTSGSASVRFVNCTFGQEGELDQYRTHQFSNSSNLEFVNCHFTQCKTMDGEYQNWSHSGVLCFTECSGVSIRNSVFESCSSIYGGALHISNCNEVNIEDCNFDNNDSMGLTIEGIADGTEGGAIYINNSSNVEIMDNSLIDNSASGGGGAIFMDDCSLFYIKSNEFMNNSNDQIGSDMLKSDSVCFQDCQFSSMLPFERNVVNSNSSSNSPFLVVVGESSGVLNVINCVFDFDHINDDVDNYILLSQSPISAVFNNCVFSTGNQRACFTTDGTAQVAVKYSLFNYTYDGIDTTDHVISNVPDMGLNANYVPIWNTTQKSICIDNGNPDTNDNNETWITDHFDRDVDGTQKDIGAKPLIDGHIHRFHNLTNDKVRYISFPGVVNHPLSGNQNLLYHMLNEILGNELFRLEDPVLERIKWIYNDDEGYATPTHIPEHYVCSQNGYKVELLETADDVLIQYQGFYPGNPLNEGMFVHDLDRYTTNHYILPPDPNTLPDSYTGVHYRDIYLGYYLQESLKPFDALLPILDNITAIMAEDWAMARLPVYGYSPNPGAEPSEAYTNNWLGCFSVAGKEITINPGEMVVIRYIGTSPVEFKLGGENPDPPFTDPYYREMPSHFWFEEKPDYIPIFLSIDLNQFEDGNKPTEVAVFVDEECKGAAVIKDGQVQLNAYITNITDPSEELKTLEFRMYFPGKAVDGNVNEYSVLNNQTGCFENRMISVSECHEFLQINLGNTEEPQMPSVTSLLTNYPNPFNPETCIKFEIANESNLTIEVFNIKGQKVKTLVRGAYTPGYYSVIWNGTDDSNKHVTSGVYFYRMTTRNEVLTKKMLLLK